VPEMRSLMKGLNDPLFFGARQPKEMTRARLL